MSYRGYWKRNWIQVFRRVWAEMLRDDVFGASAQLAYYFLLGFFPFLVFLVSLLAFIPLDEYLIRKSDLLLQIERLVDVMPPAAGELIQRTLESLATRKPALLSLGAAGALLAASNAMRPVMLILNRAWGVPEGRSFGKRYLLSLVLTLVFVVLVMAGAALLVLSERTSVWIASRFAPVWATFWRLGSLAAGYGALLLVVESIYHVAPNVRRPWRWITPGSVLAVLLWIVGVRVFSTYVTRFGAYEIMYGGLGAVVVFLLWLYIAGLAVLVGGELNAELERSAGIIAIVNVQPSPHDSVETRSMDGVSPDRSHMDSPPTEERNEAGATDRPG